MNDVLKTAELYTYEPIKGRILTNESLELFFDSLNKEKFNITIAGYSVEQKPIYNLSFGKGKIKVLMWSQMHGNESTTTKGLIDYLNFLNHNDEDYNILVDKFTFILIPILNPDGAEYYTRVNANQIDLNRDAYNCTQPESKVLRSIVESFKPEYCFNLHDQRTIFGLKETKLPATMSFLTAAYDESRNFNLVREKAAQVIVNIYNELSKFIPGQIGRFDDSFNINCTGDYFTSLGIPTILFEAGHFQNDYNRDRVRNFVFIAINSALDKINENVIEGDIIEQYLNIYQNSTCFFDIIFKKIKIIENNLEKIITFAVQFSEEKTVNGIKFVPKIEKININDNDVFGHLTIDGENELFENQMSNMPVVGDIAEFNIGKRHYKNNLNKEN